MEEFLNVIRMFDVDLAAALVIKIATWIGSFRLIMKPVTSFWIEKVSPYINVRPTEKLMSSPVYKAVAYVMDWTLSIKAPRND